MQSNSGIWSREVLVILSAYLRPWPADGMKGSLYATDAPPIAWDQQDSRLKRLLRMPGKYRDIRRLVDSIAPEVVLFNSTYGRADLLLIAAMFKGVRKAQIIHNFQYFLQPGMRWLYKQFDLNLVISEEVHGYIVGKHPEYASLDFFLPIFFTAFEESCPAVAKSQAETNGLLQVGVFGTINKHRRNYEGLLASLAAWCGDHPSPGFVLNLVGILPVEYREFVARHDLGRVVRHYESFVTFEEMFSVLRNVDIVMFLVDSTVPDCTFYNRYKISGTSTLIKGFQKACAASRDFRLDALLADECFFYDGSHVEQIFESIATGSINKKAVRGMEAQYAGKRCLSREEQKARLVRGLRRIGA